ncbi:CRISPR-associated protein, Cas1 family [Streptoalloteichus tenebrarius]|uniref:CRISPR-associated endonuclease Cas1 n=1 Tax=Streptoalloteichus tenebrarius (strain ATCC 17920 / DSM 40477 / JCM 4838 / CBS 697.72 / NBRC 16177 / NCIMB 11028 / NRRL B-12390 / A12253. 1 / ISP 5477) TaxID=1933 RepID=A0ABT1I0F9_STRSD|nr:type I-E CRISPR-associated endonuclease Cas1e [Streptoalloteichus tenebrarius]MCP2261244.1 CRISPR-associated protein, Cas1 family [Streptoalloteichus tenebrarius]
MADIWWKADPLDLHRLVDRVSSIYVERSHIDRDENAVVLINKRETVRVPAALIAVMLLGPGTRITHGAVNLLGDSGTAVCWVGEQGVRLYASGLGPSRGAGLLNRQAWLVSRRQHRLAVARAMYGMRFPGEDVSEMTMRQLRGREGARVRKLYQSHSRRTGVPWNGRVYRPGEPFAAGDDLNRLLSAANAALYGICHAVIVGLGASPGLGFVHTGAATSFVMDIADLYKAEYTIPLAFDLAAKGLVTERDARVALRDRIAENRLLGTIIRDVKALLTPEGAEGEDLDQDLNELWDEEVGSVPGGVNWSSEPIDDIAMSLVDPGMGERHIAVVGPEFDTPSDGLRRPGPASSCSSPHPRDYVGT